MSFDAFSERPQVVVPGTTENQTISIPVELLRPSYDVVIGGGYGGGAAGRLKLDLQADRLASKGLHEILQATPQSTRGLHGHRMVGIPHFLGGCLGGGKRAIVDF